MKFRLVETFETFYTRNDDEFHFHQDLNFKDARTELNLNDIPKILYHGTSLENAKKILNDGTIKQGMVNSYSSKGGVVYLTSSKKDAEEYAHRYFKDSEIVIFAIKTENLDLDKLCIDSNELYYKNKNVLDVYSFSYRDTISLDCCVQTSLRKIALKVKNLSESKKLMKHFADGIMCNKQYIFDVIPKHIFYQAQKILKDFDKDFSYNCVRYFPNDYEIMFQECPVFEDKFDNEQGKYITVSVKNNCIKNVGKLK